jgi:hypothetical protein
LKLRSRRTSFSSHPSRRASSLLLTPASTIADQSAVLAASNGSNVTTTSPGCAGEGFGQSPGGMSESTVAMASAAIAIPSGSVSPQVTTGRSRQVTT